MIDWATRNSFLSRLASCSSPGSNYNKKTMQLTTDFTERIHNCKNNGTVQFQCRERIMHTSDRTQYMSSASVALSCSSCTSSFINWSQSIGAILLTTETVSTQYCSDTTNKHNIKYVTASSNQQWVCKINLLLSTLINLHHLLNTNVGHHGMLPMMISKDFTQGLRDMTIRNTKTINNNITTGWVNLGAILSALMPPITCKANQTPVTRVRKRSIIKPSQSHREVQTDLMGRVTRKSWKNLQICSSTLKRGKIVVKSRRLIVMGIFCLQRHCLAAS